jgi:hypothetical protein
MASIWVSETESRSAAATVFQIKHHIGRFLHHMHRAPTSASLSDLSEPRVLFIRYCGFELLIRKQLEHYPQTLFTGQQLIWLTRCTSTNTGTALGRPKPGHGWLLRHYCDKQTATGPAGQPVGGCPAKPTLSVVWRPAFLPAADQLLQPGRGAGRARLAPAPLGPAPHSGEVAGTISSTVREAGRDSGLRTR